MSLVAHTAFRHKPFLPIIRFGGFIMITIPEELTSANKAAVEASISYGKIVFESAEKLLELNFKVAKSALADSVKNARVLASATDLQELVGLRQSIAQPAVEKMIAYSKAVYEVAGETHSALQSFADTEAAEAKNNVVALLDKAVQSAPVGSEIMQAALKSVMAAANIFHDSTSKAAKQVAQITQASVAAAAPGYALPAMKKVG
jgi:phasin family protein